MLCISGDANSQMLNSCQTDVKISKKNDFIFIVIINNSTLFILV